MLSSQMECLSVARFLGCIIHYQRKIFVCGKTMNSSYFDRERWAYVGEESSLLKIVHCCEVCIDDNFIDCHPVAELDSLLHVVSHCGLFGSGYE